MQSGTVLLRQCIADLKQMNSLSLGSGIITMSATKDGRILQRFVMSMKIRRQANLITQLRMPIQPVEPMSKVVAGGKYIYYPL